MKKICVVTATRAEYGLLRRVINEIYQDKELELCLVVTGTHLMKKYGYTIEEIEKDGFPIAQKIEVSTQGNSEKEICYTMGEMTMKFADMYEQQKPDMLIVEGDRYELLPICSTAMMFGIPIAHISGGEVTEGAVDDVLKLSVANSKGEMVPFSSFTQIEQKLGMDQINRYNMYSAASITITPAAGSSSGQAIEAVGSLIKNQLGNEFGYEWTSVAYQETHSGNTTTIILIMALLVAYLVLAAQYESWTSPVAAVMGLPVAILGAMLGCWVMGVPVSIYTQIGIILLIALSAKNGILIVEFARDYRKAGNPIREAAYEAGHVRLRPILMTSFTFVLGVMPLLFATGAGAGSRVALGAAVVFGMAVNTIFATIYIPNWYEVMQHIQEKWLTKKK